MISALMAAYPISVLELQMAEGRSPKSVADELRLRVIFAAAAAAEHPEGVITILRCNAMIFALKPMAA